MNIEKKIEIISQVSPTFCLAKWLQVTIDLEHGTNHSCHHPQRHLIPMEELEVNLAAFHNTTYKKGLRKQMLAGERPKECSYCWQIEDAPGCNVSDRLIKSTDDWAFSMLDQVTELPWDGDIDPTYLEVMFSSRCQLACCYCMADISTSISSEMKKFGPYPVKDQSHRMPEADRSYSGKFNSYLLLFWPWFEKVYPSLHYLRITGGEPLLDREFFKLMDKLLKEENQKLTLSVNSNLCVNNNSFNQFEDILERVIVEKKVGKVEIYASVDGYGEQAEYMRMNLDYQLFMNRLEDLLFISSDVTIVLMCTYNILSMARFNHFLEDVYQLKLRFSNLILDTGHLINPEYLQAAMATDDLLECIKRDIVFMKSKGKEDNIFSSHEIGKLERIYHWITTQRRPEELLGMRADFYRFIKEYDRRYGKDFITIFPEYQKMIKVAAKSSRWEKTTGSKSLE